jgi:hypothetical protein
MIFYLFIYLFLEGDIFATWRIFFSENEEKTSRFCDFSPFFEIKIIKIIHL